MRSCLLITLIKCLKGQKSIGSLCVVKTLIVSGNKPRDRQCVLLSCSGQLKNIFVTLICEFGLLDLIWFNWAVSVSVWSQELEVSEGVLHLITGCATSIVWVAHLQLLRRTIFRLLMVPNILMTGQSIYLVAFVQRKHWLKHCLMGMYLLIHPWGWIYDEWMPVHLFTGCIWLHIPSNFNISLGGPQNFLRCQCL